MALIRLSESHNLTVKKLKRDSSRTALVNPPHDTRSPCLAPKLLIVPCNPLNTVTSIGVCEDFTCTHILGSLNPIGPVPASMSTPPSGPGFENSVTYP